MNDLKPNEIDINPMGIKLTRAGIKEIEPVTMRDYIDRIGLNKNPINFMQYSFADYAAKKRGKRIEPLTLTQITNGIKGNK